MRILGLVLVFGVAWSGASCGGRAAPVRVGSDAATAVRAPLCKPAPAGTPGLFLPAIEVSTDLKLDVDRPGGVEPEDWKGKLTVDGVVTASMWPMQPPSVHRLPDGRSLLNDTYNANLLMLWDPRTKQLTELARGVLMRVSGHGMLVYTGDGENTDVGVFSDIDPAAPRLRELWRFERGKADAAVVGAIDGMPALMVGPAAGTWRHRRPTRVKLLCMSGAGVSGRFEALIPAGYNPVGVDPIDGHRMLLLGVIDHEKLYGGGLEPPFDAEVAVLDLATGAKRKVARVAGGWTQFTAIPHPVLRVAWNDGTVDTTAIRFGGAEDAVTLVDPATEQLMAPPP